MVHLWPLASPLLHSESSSYRNIIDSGPGMRTWGKGTTCRAGKIMQNMKPPWWTKLKTWKEKMFEVLEKVISFCICSSFSQLTNILFGSSFKVLHLIGRNLLLCLYIKCSHKNCLYSHADRAQSTMGFMRPIAANQGSDKKHPTYFSRIIVHSCIFKYLLSRHKIKTQKDICQIKF